MRTATRVSPGTSSSRSCRDLASSSGRRLASPVMLPRMAQTLDEPELHRSAHAGHDDRDRGRRLPCGLSHCRGPSDDHLYVEPDELCREPGEAVHMALREPGLDHEVPPFHPSQSLETLAEPVHRWI